MIECELWEMSHEGVETGLSAGGRRENGGGRGLLVNFQLIPSPVECSGGSQEIFMHRRTHNKLSTPKGL